MELQSSAHHVRNSTTRIKGRLRALFNELKIDRKVYCQLLSDLREIEAEFDYLKKLSREEP